MGRAQHAFTTALTTSVDVFSAAAAAESGAESCHCPTHTHLLLLQLGDLLLYHGDLAVHPIHILDELLLGEPWRYTSSNSGSACGGLGGDTGSSLPVRLRSCGGGKTGVESAQGAPPSPQNPQVSSHDFRHQHTGHLSCQAPCAKYGVV